MLDGFLKSLLGRKPCAVRYCESDGSVCDAEGRADVLRARIERMRSTLISGF